jgi:hypothetical protein
VTDTRRPASLQAPFGSTSLELRLTATIALAFPVIAVAAMGGILLGLVALVAEALGLFLFLLADVVSRGGRVR